MVYSSVVLLKSHKLSLKSSKGAGGSTKINEGQQNVWQVQNLLFTSFYSLLLTVKLSIIIKCIFLNNADIDPQSLTTQSFVTQNI